MSATSLSLRIGKNNRFKYVCSQTFICFNLFVITMKEMVGGCCVCSDERGFYENPLVYCDGQGCNVAVHQGLYQHNHPLS